MEDETDLSSTRSTHVQKMRPNLLFGCPNQIQSPDTLDHQVHEKLSVSCMHMDGR